MAFKGKVVVVTGGAQGIGKCIAALTHALPPAQGQVQPRIRQFLKPDVAEMTTDDQAGSFLGRG